MVATQVCGGAMAAKGDDASVDEPSNAQEEQEQQEDPQEQDDVIQGINDLHNFQWVPSYEHP